MSEAHSIERETALEYDGGQPGYASGKWELERLAREEAGRGRPVQVLRPFNVVGPGQSGRYGMVLPTFVAAALCRRPLVIFDDGLQTRSFADVARFADCVLRLITSAEAWHDGARGTNVGAPTETRILDLARIVLHETGSSSTLRSIPYELVFPDSRDVRGRLPDVTRLGNLIGEVRWPPIAEIVRRCVERLAGDRMNEIRSLRP